MLRAAVLFLTLAGAPLLLEGAEPLENKTLTSRSDSSRRILYGNQVEKSDYPYLVALQMPTSFCGGAIIAERWIMTAAHCIFRASCNVIKIMPTAWEERESIFPVQCYFHDKYREENQEYDIGVLEVKPNMLQDGRAKAIKLPAPGIQYPSGTPVYLVGWGKTEDNEWPYPLYRADLYLDIWEACNRFFRNNNPAGAKDIPIRSICLGEGGPVLEGTCFGDSGGPAVTPDGAAIGIISFLLAENGFCKYGGPSFLTSVVDYLPWILNHVDPSIDTSGYPVSPEHDPGS